jgi:hypothetical protein
VEDLEGVHLALQEGSRTLEELLTVQMVDHLIGAELARLTPSLGALFWKEHDL